MTSMRIIILTATVMHKNSFNFEHNSIDHMAANIKYYFCLLISY